MKQTKLIEKLINASNEIHKNGKPQANYIHFTEDFIRKQANERGVSFDMMVEILKSELNPDNK